MIPNETFCLSVDWAIAGDEIMKNTDVSKSKKIAWNYRLDGLSKDKSQPIQETYFHFKLNKRVSYKK